MSLLMVTVMDNSWLTIDDDTDINIHAIDCITIKKKSIIKSITTRNKSRPEKNLRHISPFSLSSTPDNVSRQPLSLSSSPDKVSGKVTKDTATVAADGGRTRDDARAMARISCNITDVQVFPCTSGECVPLALRCNDVPECTDGSDEEVAECGEFSLPFVLFLFPCSSSLSLFPYFPFLFPYFPYLFPAYFLSCSLSHFLSSVSCLIYYLLFPISVFSLSSSHVIFSLLFSRPVSYPTFFLNLFTSFFSRLDLTYFSEYIQTPISYILSTSSRE